MKISSALLVIVAISTSAFGGVCKDSIRLKGVYLTEKRVEVETKKDGVTFAQIIDCLRANSEQVGDFNFEKPTKEAGAKTFPAGKRVIVSKNEYDPHHWIFSYRHQAESLSGNSDVKIHFISQMLKLTRKNRLSDNVVLDVSGGVVISRAHLVNPDSAIDAANDVAATGGLRLRIRTSERQEFALSADADRFYILETNDDKFIYRGHARLGWEGTVSDLLVIGLHGGINALTEGGSVGSEGGVQFRFRFDQLTLFLGSQYESIALKEESIRGFAHSLGMEILF